MSIDLISSTDLDDPSVINFYGGNREAFLSKDPYVILVGPANTGKTFTLCFKMHMFCLKYPGVKVLMTRKSLRALRDSAVRSYQEVLEKTGMTDIVRTLGLTRPTNFLYPYAEREENGVMYKGESEIILAPLDMKGKLLGIQCDMVYVNQPDTEGTTLEEFRLTKSRARLENSPYRQIIADPNPAHDKHWLLEGEQKGDWKLIASKHKDNPRLFDQKKQDWTLMGKEQLEELAALPGHLRESLLEGKWFSTTGMAFASYWDDKRHIISLASREALDLGFSVYDPDTEMYERAPYLHDWHHYLAIDWGFTDAFVAILIAKHPDKDLLIAHRHIYVTRQDINAVSAMTARMISGYNIKAIIADRGRAESTVMEGVLGIPITNAKKGAASVLDSINICISELNSDRWKFLNTADSLYNPYDPELVKGHKFMGYEEIPNLKKDDKTGAIAPHQQDHFYDAWKYFCRFWAEEHGGARRKETVLWM